MCPRTAFRVSQDLAAARSVPLVNPGSGAWEDPPFLLPHALWLYVQVAAKCYQGTRAMPQPPLLGLCRFSIDYYPFKAPTHGKISIFLLESSTVA